jgi:outer membrane lipase/esterase
MAEYIRIYRPESAPLRRHGYQSAPPQTSTLCAVLAALLLGLSLVTPVQAQSTRTSPPLSGIPGLTPPEEATGRAVETLCPQLSPNQTAGGQGDLQIRCTELIGNAEAGNTAAARVPLLSMAPEEIVAQGTNAVETSNRNIGARLAALHGGVTALGFRRFTVRPEETPVPGTLVASLAPFAAVASTVPGSAPGAFSRLGVFANGTYTRGDKDATSREAGFDFDTWGATLGADYKFTNNFALGVAFNYLSTQADFDRLSILRTPAGGGVDTRGVGFSLYGTYYVDKFYVDGIVTFGWNNYDTDRRIVYTIPATSRVGAVIPGTTTVNQTATGDTDGRQYSLSFGAGYDFTVNGWTVGPLVRLEYMKLNIDAYREEINNSAPGFGLNLAFEDQDVESLMFVLGGQASYAISTAFGVLLPQARIEWRHEFKNDSRTVTARFVNDPTRTPLLLVTDDPDRNFFNLGAGLSATFRGGVAAFVYYETVLGLADVSAHNVVFGVRLEF